VAALRQHRQATDRYRHGSSADWRWWCQGPT